MGAEREAQTEGTKQSRATGSAEGRETLARGGKKIHSGFPLEVKPEEEWQDRTWPGRRVRKVERRGRPGSFTCQRAVSRWQRAKGGVPAQGRVVSKGKKRLECSSLDLQEKLRKVTTKRCFIRWGMMQNIGGAKDGPIVHLKVR